MYKQSCVYRCRVVLQCCLYFFVQCTVHPRIDINIILSNFFQFNNLLCNISKDFDANTNISENLYLNAK